MNDALGRAGGAEGDDRHAERGRRAGAAAVHEQRTGREHERGRGQAGEAADDGSVTDQRTGRDRQRIDRLIAGERVGGGGAGPEGLRGPGAEDIVHRGVTGESGDAVGGGIGGELVAEDGHLGKQPGRGGRQGRRGREEEAVVGRTKSPDDVQGAPGVDGQRSESQRRRAGAGQADGIPTGVRRERSGRLDGGIRDILKGATLQGDASGVDTVVAAAGGIIETQDGAAGDGGERVGAPEGDCSVGRRQDDRAAMNLETSVVIDRAHRRIDGQRAGAILVHAPQSAGLGTRGTGQHDVAFGIEL